jgi:probable rRNA maturation factor
MKSNAAPGLPVPRTMILLDPDLDPYPAAKSPSTALSSAGPKRGKSLTPSSQLDLPTARTLARFLGRAQQAVGLKGLVTVLLTTDAAIRGMNRKFRNKNKATDVLSFPAEGPAAGTGRDRVAGDLAISVTTAMRQAREQGHPLWMEIKVLIVHGLLHLAGYDHETDKGRMARRERALRAELRLPQGLIERVESHPGIKTPAKAKKP